MRILIFLIGILALAVCVYGIVLFRKRLKAFQDGNARVREEMLLAQIQRENGLSDSGPSR